MEFKMTEPSEIIFLDKHINSKLKWVKGSNSLEVFNSVFKIIEKKQLFRNPFTRRRIS